MSILGILSYTGMNNRLLILKGFCIAMLSLLPHNNTLLQAQTPPSKEYQIKAVFLFNFTQFVEWPTDAFSNEKSPLIIGVLGEDPFGFYLEETIRNEEKNGHSLIVQRYRTVEEVKTCHIMFVNLTKPDQLKQACESLKTKHILTVSDASNFTRFGGMIRLFTEKNKTRIQINLEAAKDANLNISSKLLKLAEIVTSQKD